MPIGMEPPLAELPEAPSPRHMPPQRLQIHVIMQHESRNVFSNNSLELVRFTTYGSPSIALIKANPGPSVPLSFGKAQQK
jgi:hypothetical protein